MFTSVPDDYDSVHSEMSRQGARVLALGHREIGHLSSSQIRQLKREEVERDLEFDGFVIISCPLKRDSKSAIKEIQQASHHTVMITGDNPLTACHVAKELRFTRKQATLVLTEPNHFHEEWHWQSIDDTVILPMVPAKGKLDLIYQYDLCITGQALTHFNSTNQEFFNVLLPYVKVFARVAPKQKELVITTLKKQGFTTLMCGDGTNDVGALKHAHVGVALLSKAPLSLNHRKKPKDETDGTNVDGTSADGVKPLQIVSARRRSDNHKLKDDARSHKNDGVKGRNEDKTRHLAGRAGPRRARGEDLTRVSGIKIYI
ncbi:putative manganese-transporting ATPase 13A1 [Apostichopus japonicus]|uniref:Putative manganese-transporting ATPase 13A1 n=1 Tax=Stichopus japonicus TaxID=307972 RepID=A0A2G8LKS8_STIJA|nr:putative manganese-transporting ATPase 13A1 [Apostichopus japonicus]